MFFVEITVDPKSQNVSAGAILATVHPLLNTASRFQTKIFQVQRDANVPPIENSASIARTFYRMRHVLAVEQ